MQRAADKSGFNREKYIEGKLPTNFSNLIVVPFFGDEKHEFILATMLLHRLKEDMPSKYFVLCGWPGHSGFFPYVDEYWGIKDEGAVKVMLPQANGFGNDDKRSLFYHQQLNRFFETLTSDNFTLLYKEGLTKQFFDRFKFVIYKLPAQPGLKPDMAKMMQRTGNKIFIKPVRKIQSWRRGRVEKVVCKIEFWNKLIEGLIAKGHVPVIKQDASTYDLSAKYANDCILSNDNNILNQFALMRSCVVLDVFSGLSRTALAARSPFISLVERQLQIEGMEYELDDLCGAQLPHAYIFSFATMLEGRDYINLVDLVLAKIQDFVPMIDPNQLPSTAETSISLPYMLVRKQKAKRFGTRFFKIEKI